MLPGDEGLNNAHEVFKMYSVEFFFLIRPLWKEKALSPSVTTHSYCLVFHTKQFSISLWIPTVHPTILFWDNQPGVRIRSHKLRAQSTRRPPPQMPILSLRLSVVLLTDSLVINRASITLSLSLFAQMAHRTQENSLLIRLPVCYKNTTQEQPDRSNPQDRVYGKVLGASMPSPGTLPQHPHVSTSPETLQTPTLETFMEDSPNRHDQLLTQSLAPFPP